MRLALLLPAAIAVCLVSCKHKPEVLAIDHTSSGYPDNIASIMVTRCATAGCHNAASYTNAAGLRLDKWGHVFEGGNSGAVVIPYSTNYSSLLYYINTDSLLGLKAQPTMPVNGTPLTKEEYLTIVDWIAKGAPDRNGNIAFSSDAATRQKHYLTMQGCDKIAVIDGVSKLVMRYIEVGTDPSLPEQPHSVRFSKDGRYAFTCFQLGEWVQKIDVATDKVIQQVHIGPGKWNVIQPSADGSMALVTAVDDMGKVAFVNFNTGFKYVHLAFKNPHGIATVGEDFRTSYVTSESSNGVYKLHFDTSYRFMKKSEVALADDIMRFGNASTLPSPHELLVSPDDTKLFATCQESHEIRVLNLKNDSLIGDLPSIIAVGQKPLEMAMSRKYPYLFVTCGGEPGPKIGNATYRGAVYIINYNTHQVIGKLEGNFADPHGIVVDDRNSTIIVAHANISELGPDGHHSSDCGRNEKNGYYTVYDLNTLRPVSGKRYEVLPVPYGFDTRFK